MYLISLDGARLLSEDYSADPDIDTIKELSESAISEIAGGDPGCSGNSCGTYGCGSFVCGGNACGGYACGIQGCAGNICGAVICGARFGVVNEISPTDFGG